MKHSLTPVVVGLAIVAVFVLLFFSPFYQVQQTEQAIVLQFGQPRQVVTEPGLHVKMPWQRVVTFENRVLNLDLAAEEVIAQDKKRLMVDAFARWKITDPLRFYQTLADEDVAHTRLGPILSSSVRSVLGSHDFSSVLSDKRAELMHSIRDGVNDAAKDFGISIIDVRIRRADLPEQNSLAIYQRMQQERKREANEYRAQGEELSRTIRADADKQVTIIKAEATKKSEILRGEGDAQKTQIMGQAFGQDADFFSFYRSLSAYQESLKGDNTTLVLSPDSEFFRYFKNGPK
jgi:membrane protease subunit HflC